MAKNNHIPACQPEQQNVVAAIAAARAALEPAVREGMFSRKPLKRLSKFFLKLEMTSLGYNEHSYWSETLFHYDDERARSVIAKAKEGNIEADAILRDIARARLRQGLPPNLADYIDKLLAHRNSMARLGRPRYFDRDVIIYFVVEDIKRRGFDTTRNDSTRKHESACSIVAAALKELGKKMPEKTVERIWHRIHSTLNSVLT